MSDDGKAPRVSVETGRGYALGVCPGCPPWRTLQADRSGVLLAAATHALEVHGDASTARDLRKRAAATRDTPRRGKIR